MNQNEIKKSNKSAKRQEMILSLSSMFPETELDLIYSVLVQVNNDESQAIELLLQLTEGGESEKNDKEKVEQEDSEEEIEQEEENLSEENIELNEDDYQDELEEEEEQVYEMDENGEIVLDQEENLDDLSPSPKPIMNKKIQEESFDSKMKRFLVLSESDLLLDQEKEIKKIKETLQLKHKYYIESLLKVYNWNSEKLILDFGDHGLEYILKKCGLLVDNNLNDNLNDIGTCDACYSDDCKLIPYKVCGHSFCKVCWRSYLDEQIEKGTINELKIKCMDYSCKALLSENFILKFYKQKEDAKTMNRFIKSKIDNYVSQHFRLKWCPLPHCGRCIKKLVDGNLYYVKCFCDSEFCFHCSEEPHYPASCEMFFDFIKRSKEDSLSIKFIKETSQQCPHCKVFVNKEIGCDHITCKCGAHFCYVCGSDWNGHAYGSCYEIMAKKKAAKKSQEEEIDLLANDLFESFIIRYNQHRRWLEEQKQSQYLRTKLIQCKLRAIESLALIESDFKFLYQALSTIIRSRRLMKSCYIFAFYAFGLEKLKKEYEKPKIEFVPKSKENLRVKYAKEIRVLETYGALFDNHLTNLEKFVGKLLTIFETFITRAFDQQKFTKTKLEMNNLMDLITKQQDNVIHVISQMEMKELENTK